MTYVDINLSVYMTHYYKNMYVSNIFIQSGE